MQDHNKFELVINALNDINANFIYRLKIIEQQLAIRMDEQQRIVSRLNQMETFFKERLQDLEISFTNVINNLSVNSQTQELQKIVDLLADERAKITKEVKKVYNSCQKELKEVIVGTFDKITPNKKMGPQLLMNKKVETIYINEEKDIIKLKTDKGFIAIEAQGDCCSESWFEHTNHIDELIGSTIEGCEEILLEDVKLPATRQDVDELYAFKILYKKGRYNGMTTLEFRNSSNGYYGGYLVIEKTSSNLYGFIEITKDI